MGGPFSTKKIASLLRLFGLHNFLDFIDRQAPIEHFTLEFEFLAVAGIRADLGEQCSDHSNPIPPAGRLQQFARSNPSTTESVFKAITVRGPEESQLEALRLPDVARNARRMYLPNSGS